MDAQYRVAVFRSSRIKEYNQEYQDVYTIDPFPLFPYS